MLTLHKYCSIKLQSKESNSTQDHKHIGQKGISLQSISTSASIENCLILEKIVIVSKTLSPNLCNFDVCVRPSILLLTNQTMEFEIKQSKNGAIHLTVGREI